MFSETIVMMSLCTGSNSLKTWQYFKSSLSLLVLSGVAYLISAQVPKYVPVQMGTFLDNFWWKSLGLLPLACALFVLLQSFVSNKLYRQYALVALYLIFFALLCVHWQLAAILLVGHRILFELERRLPKQKLVTFFFLIFITVLMYFPTLVYSASLPVSKWQMFALLLFKTCMMMRTVAWIVDRRIYNRQNYGSIADYFEFLFCPIFFVFPGQIQYFLYGYFHQSKADLAAPHLKTLGVGLWGLLLIVLFGYANFYFWQNLYPLPGQVSDQQLPWLHLGFGVYWLIAIYFQQAGGMAFQVSVARFLGYQIKYDMHYPLLARSPLDYLRRHSSYVRDYVVEMGLRPLSLPLMRAGLSAALVFPLASLLAYGYFILPQTGYRPDYERPWMVSFLLWGFLALYLVLPLLSIKSQDNLLKPIDEKPLKKWQLVDYGSWLWTMFLVAGSKSLLGIALAYFGHHKGL